MYVFNDTSDVLYRFVDSSGPAPASFASDPAANSTSAVSMTASTATDAGTGVVYYRFVETSGNEGGTSSSWQSSLTYTDEGLRPCTTYTYAVEVKDAIGNQGSGTPISVKTACLGGGIPDLRYPVPMPSSVTYPSTGSSQSSSPADTAAQVPHPFPDGTLIKYVSSPKVYHIEHGEKHHIADPYTFLLLGFKWNDIVPATDDIVIPEDEQLQLPRGSERLAKKLGDPRVYLIRNGSKYHIVDEPTFYVLGFDFMNVVADPNLDSYRTGVPIEG
jgi:hypothetical protein